MKIRSLFTTATAILLLVAAGCATRDYNKGYASARSIDHTSENVEAQQQALQYAMASLDELFNAPAPDLRQQSKRFRGAIERLEAASERTIASGISMRLKSEEFFAQWDTELEGMSYQAVRERSQGRRQEVSQRFETVAQRLAEAQEVMLPLTNYLWDLERALGTDLTLDGLAAMKPVSENAKQNASKVETALVKLSDALKEAAGRMSPIVAASQDPATSPK